MILLMRGAFWGASRPGQASLSLRCASEFERSLQLRGLTAGAWRLDKREKAARDAGGNVCAAGRRLALAPLETPTRAGPALKNFAP
jgi:hypothetical protein